jgi:hypothetical protein
MELTVIQSPDQVVEALVTQVLAAIESRHAQAAANWLSIEEAAGAERLNTSSHAPSASSTDVLRPGLGVQDTATGCFCGAPLDIRTNICHS